MKKKEQEITDKDKQTENKKKNISAGDKGRVELGSRKLKNREKNIRIIKIGILLISLFLIIIYFLLRLVYEGGAFTVSLDNALARKSGLVMYEKLADKNQKQILKVEELEFIDNISVNWLPADINNQGEGTHNGDNYIAYTFYLENMGVDNINYWYTILTDDVIRNVDRAIRIMVFRNDEKEIYAKRNESSGQAESGTMPFLDDMCIMQKQRTEFAPGQIDKFTIVIWIEGDDPDCVDALIGGMMKIHMDITEEHVR